MSTPKEINLLPLRFRQRTAIRRLVIGWSWAAAAVASCCVAQISTAYTRHSRHAEQVAMLDRASQPVVAMLEHRRQLQERRRELAGVCRQVEALMPSDDLLQTLGAVAMAAVPTAVPATFASSEPTDHGAAAADIFQTNNPRSSGDRSPAAQTLVASAAVSSAARPSARIQSLRIDLNGATVSPADAANGSRETHVVFTAIARDEPSLTDLITRLRANPRFRNVRLRGTAEHDTSGGRRAEVEAEVVVEKELPE